jgi:hypothetical protein
MPKAYEVTRCFDCPNARKDGHYSYCRENPEKGMVSCKDAIPAWCPLPDMPPLAASKRKDKETP